MLTARIHGLDVSAAPLAEEPALLCYTPNWEERRGTEVLCFEGDHVGAVVFHLEVMAWVPVDTEFWPLDKEGEPVYTTFGDKAENLARIKTNSYLRLEDAVCFLATWWNANNPSQSVTIDTTERRAA